MNRGQRKLKHFTTTSEIKSYQKHLQKHKPQEMITQYAYVTNSFMTSECKNLVWQKQDLLRQSLECYMPCVVLVTFARERKELNRLSFAWNCSWLFFYESYKFNFQRVVCKQRNWQWIYTFVYTFFVSVTQSGLARISKTDASLERSVFAKVVAYQFINFKWKPNGSIGDCMHMHRSIRVVYDRSRLKRVKLRANVRTQQLQTLVGVFGQHMASRKP